VWMPLDSTRAPFSYFMTEADKMGLAYICLSRHVPWHDVLNRGTPHDLMESYVHLIKKSNVFMNHHYTPEEAAKEVSEGKNQGVFFGLSCITHPGLPERIIGGKFLGNVPDLPTVYDPWRI
jgi:2,4-dienoyl-CoA reductase-like NADH-dependent reductase (Old Yellow Enzyme family)